VLDESKIPRLKDLVPRALEVYRSVNNGALTAVPYGSAGVWLAYRTDRVEKSEIEKKGYAILIDSAYKGRVSGEDHWIQRMWYAALQTGQDPNDIKNLDAIWDKVRESKANVLKYWTSGAEQMQVISDAGIAVSDAWFVRTYALKKRGVPVDGWPAKGAYVSFRSIMALKNAPLEAFYEMADIILRPEVVIALAIEAGSGPLLDPTKHKIPPEAAEIPGFDPTGTLNGYTAINSGYWLSRADEWQRLYRRVLARG
jgi:spermidine/putrescine transport system substrate-binding protein